MVAITVILAAVIGAFVLEIGDQQETAPNTSFDSDERVVTVTSDDSGSYSSPTGPGPTFNITQVSATHAGGTVIDISQANVKVEGHATTIGYANDDLADDEIDPAILQPNTMETLGTNEKVEFSSGETWAIVSHADRDPADVAKDMEDASPVNGYHTTMHGNQYAGDPSQLCLNFQRADNGDNINAWKPGNSAPGCSNEARPALLEDGQQVTIVWTASSGGKTQTLFKYAVQQSVPDA
jgi:FlaG/FlaF family flagellin (archaellin)